MPRRRKTPEPAEAKKLDEKEIQGQDTEDGATDSSDVVSDSKAVLPDKGQDGPSPEQEEAPLDIKAFRKVGPNFKIDYYEVSDEIKVQLADTRTGRTSAFDDLISVRTEREGGSYYKIEFFFPLSRDDISYSAFDNKEATIITGRTESGKLKGRRFSTLVCTGKLRGTLPGNPDVRLMKYVCRTNNQTWVSLTPPRSLKGLAAPIESK